MTRPTQGTLQRQSLFAYGPVTLYGRTFQNVPLNDCLITPVEGPTTPMWKPLRFGLFPFRSPLLRKSIFLSFPADTEMFQFSAFATRALCIQTRSVQESRDHHLFDGSPGLIAVFRALQSLLMPRHPPCALSSLTTRIECSQTLPATTSRSQPEPEEKTGITLRVSPTQPQILAGKRADTTWGSNVFSLRHHAELPKQNQTRHAIALGERRRNPVRRRALPAFFQDANYHDQIVKEQNKPTAMVSPPSLMKATPQRPAHDLFRHHCHGQRFAADSIAMPKSPKRASTHDQLPEPYHNHCGIGLFGGREPHLQSYQAAAGIRRSRAIRREPIRRTVRKLALSDRPHDWGKVRRFPGERQAAVGISSVFWFLR